MPVLSRELDIPAASQTWPSSVFSLVTGALLLPVGRLADIYGGRPVFVIGLVWFLVWSLIGAFSQNYVMLIVCRAIQGLGPAGFLPAGIGLLGRIYRPGPRKNLIFSLYGACAPIGFFGGIFFAGLSGQYISWRWYFWIGTILLGLVLAAAWWTVPHDHNPSSNVKMDWWGTLTIVPGLLLTVFAITDAGHAPNGWATSYITATIIIGGLLLLCAVYVEGWVADAPLLPFDLFRIKNMVPLVTSLFFTYGVFGIYLLYASFYIENVLGASALQTTAWFAPMAAGGLILATVGGLVLHLLPGTAMLIISSCGFLVSTLLFAFMPDSPNYWAWIFPAMIGATVAGDITYSVSNIFITTSVSKDRQGLAGALINSLLFLGISFFLGFADFAVASTADQGMKKSYKVAFWFAAGCSGLAFVLVAGFVRIGKAKSDLTFEERIELESELAADVRREQMTGTSRGSDG